jgi:hypothetical protein
MSDSPRPAPTLTVTVAHPDGVTTRTLVIPALCPVCGGPRGKPKMGLKRLASGERDLLYWWKNPCGHVDTPAALIAEAKEFREYGDLPF